MISILLAFPDRFVNANTLISVQNPLLLAILRMQSQQQVSGQNFELPYLFHRFIWDFSFRVFLQSVYLRFRFGFSFFFLKPKIEPIDFTTFITLLFRFFGGKKTAQKPNRTVWFDFWLISFFCPFLFGTTLSTTKWFQLKEKRWCIEEKTKTKGKKKKSSFSFRRYSWSRELILVLNMKKKGNKHKIN